MKTYAPPPQPSPSAPAVSQTKLRQFVTEAVFRRGRVFLLTFLMIFGAAVLLTLLMPRKYEADAKLMVQNVRSQSPLSTTPADRLIQQNEVSNTEVNSEVDLLQSQDVARRALDGGAAPAGPTTEREQEDVLALERRLTVEAVHQTSLINLKLLGSSPGAAEQQLEAVLNAYFEARAGHGRSTGAADFFERQAADEDAQLTKDRQALTDFEVAHDLANLDDQKKLQVQRIGTIEDRLSEADSQLAREQSMTAAQRRQLSVTPSRSTTVQRTLTNQYSQERLETLLVDLTNRRTELTKRYPPTDRQVVEVNDKIATTQRAIAEVKNHPADDTATDVNPVWQQLQTSVATSSGEVSGISAQRAELMRQRTEANARLHELQEATGTYDALQRKLAQTQADYTLYAQKRDEARISQALDREKMFDVALIERPTASQEPVKPKPALYLSVGFVLALLVGMALALYTDTSAEQVYTPAQLDALTGTRTIATFADEDDADSHQASNQLEYRRVLFAIRNMLREVPRAEGVGAGFVIAFVSALQGEGTSYLVENLATEAARQASAKIAVLDMRQLLRRFEAEGHVSFALKFEQARGHWVLADDKLPDGAPLLQGGLQGEFSARLVPLLLEARKQFDFILLDCPSFQESTLASELDVCLDGYVAVVGAAGARKQNIEQMTGVLRETRTPLLGWVLNRRRYAVPGWLHRAMW